LFESQEIIDFQQLIRRIPVADNVIEYAVTLVSKTRHGNLSNEYVKNYLDWEGPRASQNLILAAKTHAVFNGNIRQILKMLKQSQLVSCHRIIKNYKADAEGVTEEIIIENCYSNSFWSF
jgi:MoxR-like ATPase